jgi:hypothetical protein
LIARKQQQPDVVVNGVPYRPVDETEAARLAEWLQEFTLESTEFWRDHFIDTDTAADGSRYGMYDEGDEEAPFFSEAFLYNLLGKDEARSVLAIMRRLSKLAGVEFDN